MSFGAAIFQFPWFVFCIFATLRWNIPSADDQNLFRETLGYVIAGFPTLIAFVSGVRALLGKNVDLIRNPFGAFGLMISATILLIPSIFYVQKRMH